MRTTDIGWHRRTGFAVVALLVATLRLSLAAPAHAQSFSTGDLQGTWVFFQLATPTTGFTNTGIRSYSGSVSFDANGVASGSVADDLISSFTITGGSFAVGVDGEVEGTLQFNDSGTNDVRVSGARLLTSRHSIIGVATVFGQSAGPISLVKLETPSLVADVAGDWNYHEVTPSSAALGGDAGWSSGTLRFHDPTDIGTPGTFQLCTEANLVRSDGTNRSVFNGNGSFG